MANITEIRPGANVEKEVTREQLCATIQTIDALSQEGFSQISALAALARIALEHLDPPPAWVLADIHRALGTIRNIADNIENSINCDAERVGCNHREDRG